MKVLYYTDDGQKFATREAALRHEKELSEDTENKKLEIKDKVSKNLEKIHEIENKIDTLAEEHFKLFHENARLIDEYKDKYASEEFRNLYDRVVRFFNLFGENE